MCLLDGGSTVGPLPQHVKQVVWPVVRNTGPLPQLLKEGGGHVIGLGQLDIGRKVGSLPELPHIPDVRVVQTKSFLHFFFIDDEEEFEEDSFKPSTLQRSASDGKLLSMLRAPTEVPYQIQHLGLQKATSHITPPTIMEGHPVSIGSQLHPVECKPCVFFFRSGCVTRAAIASSATSRTANRSKSVLQKRCGRCSNHL
ncbi:unnamed protein product [Polarella glacialis]|uniref:Uncharacterized protein n=1 Tax=Polarella glacialis TaxID=89957 RepID=A0A813JVR5_POLGL|nr:unnamed protein product [Polarella glacialis]